MPTATNSPSMLAACRAQLRLGGVTDFDDEITDLIGAARSTMRAGGVSEDKADDDADARVRVAIKTYVLAHFGADNPDAERFAASFEEQVKQMKCTEEYGGAS